MQPSCIRQTALPNISRLFADLTYHPDRLSQFYPFLPLDSDSFQKAADQIQFTDTQRRELVAALSVQNKANPLLERLAQPGTVAVVTGQQVGLFSGPLYTIYKALTAIRLAEQLTVQGISAVPIFWLATEDHDFEEVNQSWFFDTEHRAVELKAKATAGPNQPVGGVHIDGTPLDLLRTALAGLPYADEAYELAHQTYQPGMTFGESFAALLDKLLSGFPILRVDPMLPEFRRLAAPMIRKAIERAPQLTTELLERNKQLNADGYHAQVHVEQSTSLVFLLENGQRLALRRQDDSYFAGTIRRSTEYLAAHAEELSPNALLRPVVQDSMIPTIAYIGGPAELAYLAQSEVIYRHLLGRQPIALHRASFTVIGSRESKLLNRYRLEIAEFFHGNEAARDKASRALVDPALMNRISESRARAVSSLDRMASDLSGFDPSILKALTTSRRKIEFQFSKIEQKVSREALRRDERAAHDIESLSGLLYPRHKLQERLYSGLAMIAQFGPGFVSHVYEHVNLECPDHQVLVI